MSYQTVSKLLPIFEPVIRILAHADAALVWRRGVPMELEVMGTPERRARFGRLAKSLMPTMQRSAPRPLGKLLREAAPSAMVERVLFLKEAALALSGRLVPVEVEGSMPYRTGLRERVRGGVQRWALMHLDPAALEVRQ